MKTFLIITALTSLVAGLPTCPKRPAKTTTAAATTSTISTVNTNTTSYTPTANNNSTTSKLATGWYPGWYQTKFAPSQIPWEKYSALTFAFATTTPDLNNLTLPDGEEIVQEFVSQAHSHNVKALYSVGGWTGSMFFSSAVATAENRTAFTKTLVDFANKYKFDGIDFDWEYPNKQGLGCNVISDNDTANFLELLQEVRTKVGNDFQLTAAVGMAPFNGPDGAPSSDVSGFAKVLNHIAIMAYDVYGTFSTVGAGPNAPLQDSCTPTKNQMGSGASAVKAWTAAGFPANQILLGVPSYGHSYTVASYAIGSDAKKLAEYPAFDANMVPLGTGETSRAVVPDQCGNPTGPGGVFDYSDMVTRGFIDSKGNPANGVLHQFDECSQTAYIYNATSQVLINYDDPNSFKAKGNFIRDQNLGGFAMWHIASDSSDSSLLDTIIANM